MSLAVSLFGTDATQIAQRLRYLQNKDRMVELRLDRMPENLDWQPILDARGELEILLACVPKQEGGTFGGSYTQWQQCILQAIDQLGGKIRVDVPPCFADQKLSAIASDMPRVWSWHQPPSTTCDPELLRQNFNRLCSYADLQRGDVIKMVAWAEKHEDALAILELYSLPGPKRVLFAQGRGGAASRLWALRLGAPWTYASWKDEATAPGQWPEHKVRRRRDWQGTPLFGVIGDPVAHSRSPILWQTAFHWLRAKANANEFEAHPWADGLYLPLQHLEFTRQTLHQLYQKIGVQALSVTAPLKIQALKAADDVAANAQAIGAANFLVRTGQTWTAHNTDGAGALDPLRKAGLAAGAPILIVGAGGAARAAAFEAVQRGFPVTIAARRIDAAKQLVEQIQTVATGENNSHLLFSSDVADPKLFEPFQSSPNGFAVIQATPLGSLNRPGNPLSHLEFPPGGLALDMVYDPPQTEFLQAAEKAGSVAISGHHMLLAQMLCQFEIGTGHKPPTELLQLALERDLGLKCPPILLIGPRAAGKSTLGRMLADALDFRFIDADQRLEEEQQRAIVDWIPQDEPGFRAAEAELLQRLIQEQGAVIALGGGVIERPKSRRLLAEQPRVLALDLSEAEQIARRASDHRPVLINSSLPDEVHVLHNRRAVLYQMASSGRRINVAGNLSTAFLSLLQSFNLIG
ncbi:MAG: type I 3-dehydroquinate dehydratase [Planctomycetes bacterium]|nr:type I 3-dehydroquinate dehydratase [Planctomycetota bacterium]